MRMLAAILALGAMLAAASPAQAFIELPSIKNRLLELALDQISSPGSFEITVESIEDPEEGGTSLIGVKVRDNDGVWLTAERLTFAWRPDRLLAGELNITRLELVGLDVMRLPSPDAEPPELKPQEPWSQGIFDWPRAPIGVVVESVRLERAHVAEGVLPQPLRFEAQGRATDKGDLQEVSLEVTRTDEVDGRIEFLMRRTFGSEDRVKLDLSAREAPGGLVAAYAGLPGDVPARLELHADGTVDNWRLDLDADVERFLMAQGNATLDYTERLSVNADFSVAPGPELGQELRTVLGERAQLVAEIVERPDGIIEVVSGRLDSPAMQLRASGALATGAGGESDLQVSLVALAPLADLAEGVEFDRFSFDGRVTGPAGALAADGTLGLEGLATAPLDAGSLSLEGRVAQTADGATFDLAGSGEGLRIDRIGPEVIGAAELVVDGALAGDVLTLERASLDSAALSASASGRYHIAASTGQLAVELSAPEIAPVGAAYGVAAEGSVSARTDVTLAPERIEAALSGALEGFAMEGIEAARIGLDGTVVQAGERIDAEFSAETEGFAAPGAEAARLSLAGTVGQEGERLSFDLEGGGEAVRLDQVPPELTREVRVAAQGAMAGGSLELDAARIESRLLTAEASGTVGIEAGRLAVDYRLETPDLAPVAAAYGVEASGALAASGRAEGEMAAPRLVGEARLAGASYAGQSYGTVRLDHDVTPAPAPQGRISVAMEDSWLGDAEAETAFGLEGEQLSLSELEARLLGVRLAGSADVDLAATLVDGSFDVSAPDLGPLGRFAGTGLSGAASGTVRLSVAEGRQNVTATLDARRLAADGVEVAEARVGLSAADVLGTPRIDLDTRASGVAAGGAELETVTARAQGPLAALDFSAELRGTLDEDPLEASAAGRADAGGEVIQVTLSRAEATVAGDTVQLERPLRLRIGGGTVAAEELSLSLPEGGSVSGSAALRPRGYTGDLTVSRLQLGMVGRLTGMPFAKGGLDARAVFDTRPGRAGANVTAELREVVFEGVDVVDRDLDVDLRAEWDGAQNDADLEIRGDFGQPLRARLSVPLRPRSGALPAVPPDGALVGALSWSGRIGNLWALVPAPGHLLDGDANIDLTLGGTLADPRVTGIAEVTEGQYQNLALGTILTDVRIETRLLEDGDLEVTLEASDGASGTVESRVLVELGDGPVALDATATAADAVLVRRDDVTAAVSTDIQVDGPLTELDVTGDIRVDKAEVRLVNATPPEVVVLDGIRIKGAPEPEEDEAGESIINLFLSIEAERNIFVRGRGLDSEWQMDLAVTGTAAQPVVSGRIQQIRGRLSLLGRVFQLARGRVVFDGGRQIDPELDVYLEREDNDIRGGILIEGRASDPELSFTSNPALPEDEVMPRLLFGQSRQSLTGAQALQLGAGIATLMGGGSGPLDALRETAGLDVLRVEGQSVEDAAVTVGRNVGEDVFIGATQGLGGEGTKVTVEVEVFNNVTVDTEIGAEGGSNIGITLKKDF